jgi:hypothetical protein
MRAPRKSLLSFSTCPYHLPPITPKRPGKGSYMTIWVNMTLFIWQLMTALDLLFKLIILINQNDG